MKGRLLTNDEVKALVDGVKVWVEDRDGSIPSNLHTVEGRKLVDAQGRYWMKSSPYDINVYEWVEEKQMDKKIGRELSIEEIENLEVGTLVWVVHKDIPNGELREVKKDTFSNNNVLKSVSTGFQCGATKYAMDVLEGKVYEWDKKTSELTTLYNERMKLGEKLDKLKESEKEIERQIAVLLEAEEIIKAGGTK